MLSISFAKSKWASWSEGGVRAQGLVGRGALGRGPRWPGLRETNSLRRERGTA